MVVGVVVTADEVAAELLAVAGDDADPDVDEGVGVVGSPAGFDDEQATASKSAASLMARFY